MSAQGFSEVTPPVRTARRIVFLIITALLLVSLGSCAAWRSRNVRALQALEKAARDRGEPVTLAELAATYPEIPDEQNIYIALEALWESEDPVHWKAFRKGQRPLPAMNTEEYPPELPILGSGEWQWSRTGRLNSEQSTAAASFLAAKKDHMTAVRNALKRPKFRARYDFNQGFLMLLPQLAMLKMEAQFFQVEVLQSIEAKDPDRALDSIQAMAQIGHCSKDDPTLIGQLVRIAIYSMTFSSAERLMAMCKLDQQQLTRLQSTLAQLDARSGLQLAYKTERVMGIDVCKNAPRQLFLLDSTTGEQIQGNRESAMRTLLLNGMAITGLKDADLRLMGETYEQLIHITGQPEYCATAALSDRVNAAVDEAKEFPPKFMSALMLPALGKAGEKFGRTEALRRSSLAAIQIELLRQAKPGSTATDWRKIIDSQRGDLGKDPFTGTTLLFSETSNGYVIYSVGPNRKDDGGQVQGPNGSLTGATDVGFTVEFPPKK